MYSFDVLESELRCSDIIINLQHNIQDKDDEWEILDEASEEKT